MINNIQPEYSVTTDFVYFLYILFFTLTATEADYAYVFGINTGKCNSDFKHKK